MENVDNEEEEEEEEKEDDAANRPRTCVFHGLMMHGEAKQNRQQSVFCLTHYMLRGRMGYVYIARVRE